MTIMINRIIGRMLITILAALLCSICRAEEAFFVRVTSTNSTVKVNPSETLTKGRDNTAEYNVSAKWNDDWVRRQEAEPVAAKWTCVIKPEHAPPKYSDLDDNKDKDMASWSALVCSASSGMWKLDFNVHAEYMLRRTGKKKKEFSGTKDAVGSANFSAVNGWRVMFMGQNIVARKAKNPPQQTIPCQKITVFLDGASTDKTVKFTCIGTGKLLFGEQENKKGIPPETTQDSLMLTIPKNGFKTFYVCGEKESQKKNDTIIAAISDDQVPRVVGMKSMTVLWVSISRKVAGILSEENAKGKKTVVQQGWSEKLGAQCEANRHNQHLHAGFAVEYRGDVMPSDFDFDIEFQRDAEGHSEFVGGRKGNNSKNFLSSIHGEMPVNDTSYAPYLDNKPPLIFDYDSPGWTYMMEDAYHVIGRKNFCVFATFGNVRCSDVELYHSITELKAAKPVGKPWNVEIFNAVLGNGLIPLTTKK